jgi:hypothetical protein
MLQRDEPECTDGVRHRPKTATCKETALSCTLLRASSGEKSGSRLEVAVNSCGAAQVEAGSSQAFVACPVRKGRSEKGLVHHVAVWQLAQPSAAW